MELTNERLLELNYEGLIPGPKENTAAFLTRAEHCLALKTTIITELKDQLPFVEKELGPATVLQSAYDRTEKLFDIAPTWIPVFLSNRQLMPWHGGCAWIFQITKDSPPMAFFQLNRAFATRDCYLGYRKTELVAHELAHVGRMTFEEPKFEELLAYETSSVPYRRWLGPILQSSYEALILLGLLIMTLVVDLFALTSSKAGAIPAAMWWKLLPAGYFAYLLARLWWRRRAFKACQQNLKHTVTTEQGANAILYRLTDAEIVDFAKKTPEQIRLYAEEQSTKSLRWRLIALAYFGM
ncbi:MAG: hypothetical protein Q8K75_06495 [Chlamydiales bacterium]|nr:hypothetical protein [Chlamydiales bacterium]